MAIADPYSPCPCGSGKKIKFCCKEIAGEIEKVQRLLEGDQPRAALNRLQLALKKQRVRPALLDMKASVELHLGQYEEARKTIDEFLVADPENPFAWARRGEFLAQDGSIDEAVDALQRAAEFSDEEADPTRLIEGFQELGKRLLNEENIFAALGALRFCQMYMTEEETPVMMQMLAAINRELHPETLHREYIYLRHPNDDLKQQHPEIEEAWREVLIDVACGRWRKAEQAFQALETQFPACQADSLFNRAILLGWLVDSKGMIALFQQSAEKAASEIDALEAIGLAEAQNRAIGVNVSWNYGLALDLEDVDAVKERLLSSAVVQPLPQIPQGRPPEGRSGPPMAAYFFLDKPLPEYSESLDGSGLSEILGIIRLYGRETDQPGLMHVTCARVEAESVFDRVAELAQVDRNGSSAVSKDAGIPALSQILFPQILPPKGADSAQAAELEDQAAEQKIDESLAKIKLESLGGKTLEEAAKDPVYARATRMLLFFTQEKCPRIGLYDAIDRWWDRLSLERIPQLKWEDSAGRNLTNLDLLRLDPATIPDESWVEMLMRVYFYSLTPLSARFGHESLRRPDRLHWRIFRTFINPVLQFSTSFDEVAKAIQAVRDAQPDALGMRGRMALFTVQAAARFNRSEEMEQSMHEVRSLMEDDSELREEFFELLVQWGYLTPDGAPTQRARQASSSGLEESAPSAEIWTPESESVPATKGEIWTP